MCGCNESLAGAGPVWRCERSKLQLAGNLSDDAGHTRPMAEFEFDYRLAGFDWADATVRIGEAAVELRASLTDYDALGDLLRGVLAIGSSSSDAVVTWDEEPAEIRWLLTRRGDLVQVAIRWFPEIDVRVAPPWSQGRTVFEGSCSFRSLCSGVTRTARKVLETLPQSDVDDFATSELIAIERIGV